MVRYVRFCLALPNMNDEERAKQIVAGVFGWLDSDKETIEDFAVAMAKYAESKGGAA